MKRVRILLTLCFATLALSNLQAEGCGCNPPGILPKRDFEQLNDYVNSKRTIPLDEKDHNLAISGDIRSAWAHQNERLRCAQQIGSGAPIFDEPFAYVPYSRNIFNVDFNLYVDYVCGPAWGVVWVAYRNRAGIQPVGGNCITDPEGIKGSGECDGLCLTKAYIGYNLLTSGNTRIDIEVGRRPLWTIFDSRIEFNNQFDGVLLKVAHELPCWVDAYVNGGVFVIDERVNNFGYVGEVGLLNIGDWGFDVKYSYIDWTHVGTNRCGTRRPLGCLYQDSQLLLAYNVNNYLSFPGQIYAAGLINTAADASRFHTFFNKEGKEFHVSGKQNKAFYVGFMVGEVCKQGDWAFDMNYQYVQALAIPDCDLSGIGNNNAGGYLIATGTIFENMLGNGNYEGWRFEGLYALTDNLTLDAVLQFSNQLKTELGGKHQYSQFLLQAIYAF